ncbi:lipoprotein, putative [Pseudooceanicola batsensis HTCC2597]|uniref:Lipoprotein, putative n=2 Tax=Pseudooceanicola batsensis TaxID=314255 RepID=A3U1G3_PSEBH|nr:lipoprotein, putative [Pseudooceanicola batsensis HTCC2597]
MALAAATLVPGRALASPFREITWQDLIPEGVPYGEIIGPGQIDAVNDTWVPQFDENAGKLNARLDGKPVKLPGYIIPFDVSSEGVTSFMLVPYVGACIHTPPPPPNQLVFVTASTPWPSESLWDPVWVSGRLSAKAISTQIAEVGYQIAAEKIEVYKWQ